MSSAVNTVVLSLCLPVAPLSVCKVCSAWNRSRQTQQCVFTLPSEMSFGHMGSKQPRRAAPPQPPAYAAEL